MSSSTDRRTSDLNVPDDPNELRKVIAPYAWHHAIDLGDGVITPGRDKSARKLAALELPPLAGKSVLDVGAWDGYFSFAAERLGAERVVALDSVIWRNVSKEPFEIARKRLRSNVEDVELEVLDISPETVGMFDVVLFLGVLYHMRDPMAALEAVASVTNDLLVVETFTDMMWSRRKAVAFYPGKYLGGDHSNWWGPNPAAAVAMVEEFGFKEVRLLQKPTLQHRFYMTARNIASIAYSRRPHTPSRLPLGFVATDRAIIHARR